MDPIRPSPFALPLRTRARSCRLPASCMTFSSLMTLERLRPIDKIYTLFGILVTSKDSNEEIIEKLTKDVALYAVKLGLTEFCNYLWVILITQSFESFHLVEREEGNGGGSVFGCVPTSLPERARARSTQNETISRLVSPQPPT